MAYTRRAELTCTEQEFVEYGNSVLMENELLSVKRNSGRRDIYYGDGITMLKDLSPSISYDDIAEVAEQVALDKIAVNTAAEQAETAKTAAQAAVGKTSYIGDDGYWYQWDSTAGVFVCTDVLAQGPQGVQGERGLQGDTGAQGADGYTPIKGVDYFTSAEVEEIKLAATPDITGYATQDYVETTLFEIGRAHV